MACGMRHACCPCQLLAGLQNSTVAESSSSFTTKQIVGYFWSVALLKKHDKLIPKRLETIVHQGQKLKGVTLEDWALGGQAALLLCFFDIAYIIAYSL